MVFRADFEEVFKDIINAVYDTECRTAKEFAEQFKDYEYDALLIKPEDFAKFCFNLYLDGFDNGIRSCPIF